jgi:hypothetical protein
MIQNENPADDNADVANLWNAAAQETPGTEWENLTSDSRKWYCSYA